MVKQWKAMHEELKQETQNVLEALFGDKTVRCGLDKDGVLRYYKSYAVFPILPTVDCLKAGDALNGYEKALSAGSPWAMRVGYDLYPDLMAEGCEETLAKAIKSRDISQLKDATEDAKYFWEQCGVEAGNYREAVRLKQDLTREKEKKKEAEEAARKKNSSSSQKRKKPSYSYSYSNDYEIDPDDYDMDAYYADNWDEYDDVEDAAEGFQDDDSEWDDY